MNIKDLQNDLDYFTGELSGLIRNLNFSGIAISWMFQLADKTNGFPRTLLFSIMFFIISLFLDIWFLLYSTRVVENEIKEKTIKAEADSSIPKNEKETFDLGGWSPCCKCNKRKIRYLKLIVCLLGYFCIAYYVYNTYIFR